MGEADPSIGLKLPKFIHGCKIGSASKTTYTLPGKLLGCRWNEGFPMNHTKGAKKADAMMVIGVKNAFTKNCFIRYVLDAKMAPGCTESDGTSHINIEWHEEFDSVHIMYRFVDKKGWYITPCISKMALPYWDIDAMLIPAFLYGLAVVLLVVLLVMLVMEYNEEPQVEYVYEIHQHNHVDAPRVDDPLPPRQKVVRRIKGAHPSGTRKCRENSAGFDQTAGDMLGRLSTLQGRVRTLSTAITGEEPQLHYDGELDQAMLMV